MRTTTALYNHYRAGTNVGSWAIVLTRRFPRTPRISALFSIKITLSFFFFFRKHFECVYIFLYFFFSRIFVRKVWPEWHYIRINKLVGHRVNKRLRTTGGVLLFKVWIEQYDIIAFGKPFRAELDKVYCLYNDLKNTNIYYIFKQKIK